MRPRTLLQALPLLIPLLALAVFRAEVKTDCHLSETAAKYAPTERKDIMPSSGTGQPTQGTGDTPTSGDGPVQGTGPVGGTGTPDSVHVQVQISAPSVSVPMTTAGRGNTNTDSIPAGYLDVVDASGTVLFQTYFGPGGPISSGGSSGATFGHLTLYEIVGSTASVAGDNYVYINIAASPGQTLGTYTLQMAAFGSGDIAYAYFDVTAAAVADTTPPTLQSASVNTSGTGLSVSWTEAGSAPVIGSTGLGLTASGGAVTLSGVSTTGTTTTATLSRTIHTGETLTLAYTPGNFTDSAATPNHVASFSGQSVTNNSTVATPGAPNAPTNMRGTAGFTPLQLDWAWDAPTSGPTPDSYNLYTGMYPGSETLRQSGITGLSFADTSITLRVPNSGYVRAVSGGMEGPPSLRFIKTVEIPPAGCSQCPPMI